MTDPAPRVVSGHIAVWRLIETAYTIDLDAAARLWSQSGRSAGTRFRLGTIAAKSVAFEVPPLDVAFEPLTVEVAGQPHQASVTARLHDFGVVAFVFRFDCAELSWPAFSDLMNNVDAATLSDGFSVVSRALSTQLRGIVGAAWTRPMEGGLEEDYLIGTVAAFDTPMTAEALLARVDLAPLLSGETRPLAYEAWADLISRRFSWLMDDLAVLTWDRAFLLEPRGDRDVENILQIANARLLEMRYYNEVLNAELPRMYDLVEGIRRPGLFRAARRYARLARRLSTLVAEVTELTEKVDGALRVTEDVYLARVYAAAVDLFRVPAFGAAVNRKLAIMRDTYGAMYEEASAARSAVMEATIVALIVLEVILALARH